MEYQKRITLKDGRACLLQNGTQREAKAALKTFIRTLEQTDYLRSYPDEITFTIEQEGQFLDAKTESSNEIEILAQVDGVVAGLAGIEAVGSQEKVRHRAEFGVSIDRQYWGLGIGTALLDACIECARKAGYAQMELHVVAENETAISIYQKAGFVVFARNPRGFKSRTAGYQEIVSMRLEL